MECERCFKLKSSPENQSLVLLRKVWHSVSPSPDGILLKWKKKLLNLHPVAFPSMFKIFFYCKKRDNQRRGEEDLVGLEVCLLCGSMTKDDNNERRTMEI